MSSLLYRPSCYQLARARSCWCWQSAHSPESNLIGLCSIYNLRFLTFNRKCKKIQEDMLLLFHGLHSHSSKLTVASPNHRISSPHSKSLTILGFLTFNRECENIQEDMLQLFHSLHSEASNLTVTSPFLPFSCHHSTCSNWTVCTPNQRI